MRHRSDEQIFVEKFLAYDSELLEDARSEYPKACSTLTGFVREMDDIGLWTPAPLVYADEGAAGPIDHSFFLELREEMRTRLLAAMPVDGVYFPQHGAAISTEHPDPDGELYEMVREIVGPDVPQRSTCTPSYPRRWWRWQMSLSPIGQTRMSIRWIEAGNARG